MSLTKSTLLDQFAERQKRQQSFAEMRQQEVQKEAAEFSSRVSRLQDSVTSQKTALEARVAAFRELLEKERRQRNAFEDQKTAEGRQIGLSYYESLKEIEEQTKEKIERLRQELDNQHIKVKREYCIFDAAFQQLMKETPTNYLREVNAQVDNFNEKRKMLESGIRALETDIQQDFRRTSEQRISAVDALEVDIATARKTLANSRAKLAEAIEARQTHLRELVQRTADELGLVSPS